MICPKPSLTNSGPELTPSRWLSEPKPRLSQLRDTLPAQPSISERQSPPAIHKMLIFPPVLGCSPHLCKCLTLSFILQMCSVIWLRGKEPAFNAGDMGGEDPLGEAMAAHSSILAGKSPPQRSLAGCSPWGHRVGRLNNKQQQPHSWRWFYSVSYLTNTLTGLTLSPLHSPQPKLEERGLKGRDQTL